MNNSRMNGGVPGPNDNIDEDRRTEIYLEDL